MAIIYETEQIYTGGFINVHKMDPIKQWSKHYGNYRYLKFLFDNTKDWKERRDANREMQVAQKKMDYWYKLAKQVDLKALEEAKQTTDKLWEGK